MVRQLADVSDEVRAVPPPPLPLFPEPYSIRFADPDSDAAMISEWMNRPHLATTWHYDRPAHEWRQHLGVQFEGSFSRPCIFSLNRQAIGYMELFRAAKDDVATVYEAKPYDVGFHGGFADPALIEKGHAAYLFSHLAASVFSADPLCRRLMADTDTSSAALGHRFAERVGCVLLGQPYIERWGRRIALFAWPRSPGDVPRLREAPQQ